LAFYENSAKTKPDTVRENLKSHNIREDLVKLTDIVQECTYRRDEMPRFKLSRH